LKFILDGMLGRLARWLRMMGHDTKYSNVLRDFELLEVAKKEDRVLLTRDFALYQKAVRKGIQAYYVEGETEPQRLSELAARFGMPLVIYMQVSRCPKCNNSLVSVSKKEIADNLEKNTFLHYDEFWRCPNCGSVYWQGAHWTKICAIINEAKDRLEKNRSRLRLLS